MKKLIFAVLMIVSTGSFAVTAFWTGRQEQVQTVSYQWAWNCQYQANGQYFWQIFTMSCPSSIEVY
jgi:heme/copper-type cytochrome/quinol oxidase subunit 2